MLRLGRQHPAVRPSGGALLAGIEVLDLGARRLQRDRLVRPGGADHGVAVLEQLDLVGGERPVLLDQRALLLQQLDGGVQLLLVELVGILDAEARILRRQIERRVGDLDRIVGHGDLALVLSVVDRRPARRRRRHLLGVVQEHVRPPFVGEAVVHAVDRVVRRRLQLGDEVGEVRNQLHVDRLHVAAVDEAQARVAGGRHEVVLRAAALAHQRHHLVRRAGVLAVHLAAGLGFERLDPGVFRVALPGHDVERALALADRLRVVRRATGSATAAAA